MKDICIILLIGLPGSGKTYLCKMLEDTFQLNQNYIIKHFCYDDLLTYNEEEKWRKSRDEILNRIDTYAINFIKNKTDKKLVILVDDNMYYISMRRFFYRLAKKQNYGIFQIYIKCTLENAIERVVERNKLCNANLRLSPDIVIKMNEKLEEPNYNSDDVLIIETIMQDKNIAYLINGNIGTDALFNKIKEMILYSLSKQNTTIEVNVEKTEHVPSILQDIDLALRKQVSESIKEAKNSGLDKNQLKLLAKTIQDKKVKFLANIYNQNKNNFVIDDLVDQFKTLCMN